VTEVGKSATAYVIATSSTGRALQNVLVVLVKQDRFGVAVKTTCTAKCKKRRDVSTKGIDLLSSPARPPSALGERARPTKRNRFRVFGVQVISPRLHDVLGERTVDRLRRSDRGPMLCNECCAGI